jgi:hypothetical protein
LAKAARVEVRPILGLIAVLAMWTVGCSPDPTLRVGACVRTDPDRDPAATEPDDFLTVVACNGDQEYVVLSIVERECPPGVDYSLVKMDQVGAGRTVYCLVQPSGQ